MSSQTRRTTRRTTQSTSRSRSPRRVSRGKAMVGSELSTHFGNSTKSAKLTTPKEDSIYKIFQPGETKPDFDQLDKLCQGYISRIWLEKDVKYRSILAKVDPTTNNWMSALFFTKLDMPYSTYITLCAVPGHGRSTFLEFVKRYHPSNIVIDSIPSAVNFWRKIGFRVIQNCKETEDKIISKMLEKYKPPTDMFYLMVDANKTPVSDKQWDAVENKMKEKSAMGDIKMRNALDDWKEQIAAYKRLREFKREDHGLRMLWCHDK